MVKRQSRPLAPWRRIIKTSFCDFVRFNSTRDANLWNLQFEAVAEARTLPELTANSNLLAFCSVPRLIAIKPLIREPFFIYNFDEIFP